MSKLNLAHFGLRINSPLAVPTAANFRPPSWPPPHDWPTMINATGEIISRWGDSVLRLDPWAGKPMSLNFGDGRVTTGEPINSANADLLRLITGWWTWGPCGVETAGTLSTKFKDIRALFVLCSKQSILASDLMRFPSVADRLPEVLAPSKASAALAILHDLYEHREELGFTLLDRDGLARLEAALPDHESKQTAYIPPRIWTYQVSRLRECLDEFLTHREQFEACYRFCIDAYATNWGSLTDALTSGMINSRRPFQAPTNKTAGARTGFSFHGHFALTAKRFGIYDLLATWVGAPSDANQNKGIALLTSYMRLVSTVGLAYLLNFSLMRIEEGWNIHADCLDIERDEKFGDIYVLRGGTTKTINDTDARWPTSPSVKVAVEVMDCLARLRMICAQAHPDVRLTPDDIANPYLMGRNCEPWSTSEIGATGVRHRINSYREVLIKSFPLLFDPDTLRITPHDLQLACLITPTLDPDKFAVGKVWPLAWHQLRRTGAVNMQASGLVSDASLQYLLKHVTRAMSLYYGQNHSRLRLNDEARTLYLRTMYEVLGKELVRSSEKRYVSPHGDKRKQEIVKLISTQDTKKLIALAKTGAVSCKEILLGLCMSTKPCLHCGADTIAHCGGGDGGSPCSGVLYDIEKKETVLQLDTLLDERLAQAPDGSPLAESLMAQKRSVENYFNVVGR